MKTPFDFNNPPESYIQAFNVWLNANIKNLAELHRKFLAESGSSKHDKGCSIDEFCAGMFRETEAGQAAFKACCSPVSFTNRDLVRLLQTFPPDVEVVIELLDGDVSVPIQGAIQYDNSSRPEIVHLLTRIIKL